MSGEFEKPRGKEDRRAADESLTPEEALLREMFPDRSEASQMTADEQARIVDKASRWLGFLDARAERVTAAARRVLAALHEDAETSAALAALGAHEDDIVEGIESVLAGFETWVEQQNRDGSAERFLVSGAPGETRVGWEGAEDEPEKLVDVLSSFASSDGEFPPSVSRAVASRIERDWASGAIELARLRRQPVVARQAAVAFALAPRGEEWQAELARDPEGAELPAEVEAHVEVERRPELRARLAGTILAISGVTGVPSEEEDAPAKDEDVPEVEYLPAAALAAAAEAAKRMAVLTEGRATWQAIAAAAERGDVGTPFVSFPADSRQHFLNLLQPTFTAFNLSESEALTALYTVGKHYCMNRVDTTDRVRCEVTVKAIEGVIGKLV